WTSTLPITDLKGFLVLWDVHAGQSDGLSFCVGTLLTALYSAGNAASANSMSSIFISRRNTP
ncbi:hypothetical protein OM174_20015, partial [Escherichia albertii]|nr:hypothetical protein [Escherichia albertii]